MVRISCGRVLACLLVSLALFGRFPTLGSAGPEHEVVKGIKTERVIQGEPYQLLGKRIVFLNWYYINPGIDADWVADGKSVRVSGEADLFGPLFKSVNHPYGIRISAQPAQRRDMLDTNFGTLIQDGKKYRAWGDDYLESEDGRSWTKGQGLPNNLGAVFMDPSAPPEERYKAVSPQEMSGAEFEAYRAKRNSAEDWEPRALFLLEEKDTVSYIRGSVSPDGIQWTHLPDPLVVEFSDTHIVAYYDMVLRKYVLYTRWWSVGPRAEQLAPDIRSCWTGIGRRAIGRSESGDFRRFPVSKMIVEPYPDMHPSDVLYTNCRTTIPNAPGQHLMFPTVWHMQNDETEVILLSSSNGDVWNRVPNGNVFSTAPFGQWDGGCVFALPNLVELPNGDFVLPYMGFNVPHKYPRKGAHKRGTGYMVWPKGRICAIEADEQGEFLMIPVIPPGRKLKINALTKRAGSILVQVEGVDGRRFEDCTPVIGDQHGVAVTWKGTEDLGHPSGGAVALRFRLNQAKLFGIDFE